MKANDTFPGFSLNQDVLVMAGRFTDGRILRRAKIIGERPGYWKVSGPRSFDWFSKKTLNKFGQPTWMSGNVDGRISIRPL